ncbi:FAD-dependent thymidylate synthase [Anaerotruncus colihominis]|uniref:FAD-dependent thymidylate synthase n=1 Tax=Anaerotruncus colihominis TaxID=169435 RepID=UPI0018A97D1D|nr:FAD-dependent thymidylate synthase [Anaerotruncus colihominis]
MKIINADVEFITPIDGAAILTRLEQCGRVCYKSEAKITDTSAPAFVAGIIKRHRVAVLEHCSFTVKFICDRGVSHEIVRHCVASYCQENTRYCNYSEEGFGSEITVIKPCFWTPEDDAYWVWKAVCQFACDNYLSLVYDGASPQEARSILPNSLKTEVVMTANIRGWRHFLKLRCSSAAHPQMREVALILLDKVHSLIPVCFDDIWGEYHEQG